MDIADLELFAAVARLGRISEAARERRLSQPTASRRLKALEEEIGCPLLARGKVACRPTAAGWHVLRFAEEVLAARERLGERLGRTVAAPSHLRVAASTVPAEELVPALIAAFRAAHPDWGVELAVLSSERVEAEVAEGRADVGFTGWRPDRPDLLAAAVAEDEVGLAVPVGHPFAGRAVALEELLGVPFVERRPGSGTRRTVETCCRALGLPYPLGPVAVEVDSTRALVAAVRHGQGVGFASLAVLERSEGVVPVRLIGVRLRRTLFLVAPRRRTPEAETFARFLAARAGRPALACTGAEEGGEAPWRSSGSRRSPNTAAEAAK